MSDEEKHHGRESDHEIVEASFTFVDEENTPRHEAKPRPAGFSMGGEMDETAVSKKPFYTIKPLRTIILFMLLYGMYTGSIPTWLGGGLIAIYFTIKITIQRFIQRLLMMPLTMKGKVLSGATVEINDYTWTDAPPTADAAEDGPPLRYVWVDATISPSGNPQGFVSWAPGELMLAPTWFKIKKVSDLDLCLTVEGVKFIEGEGTIGSHEQCVGTQRVQLLIGIPEGQYAFSFVYYLEVFGELNLAD